MKTTETYDVKKAIEAQKQLQKEKGHPDFAPSNGVCWRCRRQIYSIIEHVCDFDGEKYKTGISVEKASTELVTGCPHCHYSYCD